MIVYWLEQTEADVPGENDWLSARELGQLSALRFAKRRLDWQLGRWAAKHALAVCLRLPFDYPSLANIELRPAPSGAPEVFLANEPAPVTVSISHRAGIAVCAVALSGGALGCDLEAIEQRSDAFVQDYFTYEERGLLAQTPEDDRPLLLTLLWSAKESALKALRVGLRVDTRCVIAAPVVAPASQERDGKHNVQKKHANHGDFTAQHMDGVNAWRPLRVRHIYGPTFQGWWQHSRGLVRTMVADSPIGYVHMLIGS
jgi:4'-phosphopantetheinyl transferase